MLMTCAFFTVDYVKTTELIQEESFTQWWYYLIAGPVIFLTLFSVNSQGKYLLQMQLTELGKENDFAYLLQLIEDSLIIIRDSESGKTLEYVNELFLDRFKGLIDIVQSVDSEEVESDYWQYLNCFSKKGKSPEDIQKDRSDKFKRFLNKKVFKELSKDFDRLDD